MEKTNLSSILNELSEAIVEFNKNKKSMDEELMFIAALECFSHNQKELMRDKVLKKPGMFWHN